ncbi:hypothetical protein [Streptomyces sp. NPDC096030]|uniref:hypothetical protein n=1 Tax=Streptomyces sp. NPDC096030 TaxID=3155423 RepID=UPI00332BDA5A
MSFDGPVADAQSALRSLDLVQRVDSAGQTLTVSVSDGPSAISPEAVALSGVPGIVVQELSLRRLSLDDVFLSVTGERIGNAGAVSSSFLLFFLFVAGAGVRRGRRCHQLRARLHRTSWPRLTPRG